MGHDLAQLDLAEGAAGLLVRQDLLQPEHVARELLDVALRLVDRLQPRVQVAERASGAHRALAEAVAHGARDLGQPALHRLRHARLRRRLGVGHVGEPALERVLAVVQRPQRAAKVGQPARHAAQEHQRDQHPDRDGPEPRVVERDGGLAEADHRRPNRRSMSASFSST